jgi:hypothetical protein
MEDSLCMGPIVSGLVASLLLFYPISVKQVHPILQIAICACLSTLGLSVLVSFLVCDNSTCTSCNSWVTGLIFVFSTAANVFFPVLGAVVGMATASGLVLSLVGSILSDSLFLQHIFVGVGAVAGISSLFLWREMILHWQLFAPPVIGGYLAAITLATMDDLNTSVVLYSAWSAGILISLALHIRKRRVSSWLEKKHAEAVYSKESQIVQVMRSADPKMSVDDFEKLKERLLVAVDGDREQVDRVVFGGGLY